MKPLKVYLGDLTYTSITLATEAFPLNIGYVAAYCQDQLGDKVEINLFKYPDDLERAINASPPDILALSNYPWNHSLGLEFFQMMRAIQPETLCVMGGSNIPHRPDLQVEFIKAKPMIDVYVYLEGEIGFANLVKRVVHDEEQALDRAGLIQEPIAGCLFLGPEGEFVRGPVVTRQKGLDEFPSPYLTGLMDKFFDGKLSPMMETNRGCPFSCTFCHEGHDIFQKVNFFSMDRVMAELEYIAERVPDSIHNLMLCDPNFGMYQRDQDICKTIASIQERTGWPKDIFATTGKNRKERISNSLYELKGTMQMWISVQSMDHQVLDNIKRTNISLENMMEIQSSLTTNHLPSKSEIILGLPGETYESHIKSIADLVASGIDTVTAYTLMLLHGTELNTPEQRKQWGFITKFRILPRDFGKLGTGKNVVEVEEVVVATKDLSFDDYVALRRYHLIISIIYNGKPFASLFKLYRQLNLDVFSLLKEILENISKAPPAVRDLVSAFEQDTRDELWDSEDEARAFFIQEENYVHLVSGDLGANLLQKHVALSLIQASEEWTRYVFDTAREMVSREITDSTSKVLEQLDNLRRYSIARVSDLFGEDRNTDVPEEVLDYDIEAWVGDGEQRPLGEFLYNTPEKCKFIFTLEQYRVTEDYIGRFGRNHVGIGKTLTKMNITSLWRKCVNADGIDRTTVDLHPDIYYAVVDEQTSGGIIARR